MIATFAESLTLGGFWMHSDLSLYQSGRADLAGFTGASASSVFDRAANESPFRLSNHFDQHVSSHDEARGIGHETINLEQGVELSSQRRPGLRVQYTQEMYQ